MWIGYERCTARGAKKKMCDKCKRVVARMTHEVVAFAGGEGLYVIDAEGQHCALKYGQIDRTSQRA
eukprot:2601853-Prymnesium_polylepis.1